MIVSFIPEGGWSAFSRFVHALFFPLLALLAATLIVVPTAGKAAEGRGAGSPAGQTIPFFFSSSSANKELYTKPVFIKGPGKLAALQGRKVVTGDFYFLHVTDASDGGINIYLFRLSHATVLKSSRYYSRARDVLSLRIVPSVSYSLTNGAGEELAYGVLDSPSGTQGCKLTKLNIIGALNLLSSFRQQLHQDESIAPVDLTSSEVSRLFPSPYQMPEKPGRNILLNSQPHAVPLSIGFSGLYGRHNISTTVMMHPVTPAELMVVGPVWIKAREGTQVPCAFLFRKMASDGYSVGFHALVGGDHGAAGNSMDSLIYGLGSHYIASLTVRRSGKTITASVKDRFGIVQREFSRATEKNWVSTRDKVSLIPLSGYPENIYLPGLGACINKLSEVLEGTIPDQGFSFDDQHMDALLVPQGALRSGMKDGFLFSGAYRSDVPRNFQTLAPYRANCMARTGAWAAKKVLRVVPNAWALLTKNKVVPIVFSVSLLVGLSCYPEIMKELFSEQSSRLFVIYYPTVKKLLTRAYQGAIAGGVANQYSSIMMSHSVPPPVQSSIPLPVESSVPLPIQSSVPLPIQSSVPPPIQSPVAPPGHVGMGNISESYGKGMVF